MIGRVPAALAILLVLAVGLAAKLPLVPSTLAVYAYIRSLGSGRGLAGWAFVSGVAGLSAGLAKQPGLMTLVALFAYTLPSAFRADAARRRLLALSLGAVAAAL